jgi:hypothetical protein
VFVLLSGHHRRVWLLFFVRVCVVLMKFAPPTLAMWKYSQREEAARLGYRVTFVGHDVKTVALFFNGEFFCYTRVFLEAVEA